MQYMNPVKGRVKGAIVRTVTRRVLVDVRCVTASPRKDFLDAILMKGPYTTKGERYYTKTHEVVCQGAASKLKKKRSSEAGSELAGNCKRARHNIRKIMGDKSKKR